MYPSTLHELAKLYRVDRRTFRSWLDKFQGLIGERTGRYFSVKQVEIIIDHLGTPYQVNEEE